METTEYVIRSDYHGAYLCSPYRKVRGHRHPKVTTNIDLAYRFASVETAAKWEYLAHNSATGDRATIVPVPR